MSQNERPGGWVPGIGWVALLGDCRKDDRIRFALARPGDPSDEGEGIVTGVNTTDPTPVIVTRWADGSAPQPPTPQVAALCRVPESDGCGGAEFCNEQLVGGECSSHGSVDLTAARELSARIGVGDLQEDELEWAECLIARMVTELASVRSAPQPPTPQADGEGADTELDEMVFELRGWRDSYGPPRWKSEVMYELIGRIIDRLRSTPSVDRGDTGIEEAVKQIAYWLELRKADREGKPYGTPSSAYMDAEIDTYVRVLDLLATPSPAVVEQPESTWRCSDPYPHAGHDHEGDLWCPGIRAPGEDG